jgi:hypothetical protein
VSPFPHDRARRCALVHQRRQQLHRPKHDLGSRTNYSGPGINDPTSIVAGPDDALWSTNATTNSIGRITTSGVMTDFTHNNIGERSVIAVGPNGALRFTNSGGPVAVGSITTSGVVTICYHSGSGGGDGITAGRDDVTSANARPLSNTGARDSRLECGTTRQRVRPHRIDKPNFQPNNCLAGSRSLLHRSG